MSNLPQNITMRDTAGLNVFYLTLAMIGIFIIFHTLIVQDCDDMRININAINYNK